jgi:hypothetical protein
MNYGPQNRDATDAGINAWQNNHDEYPQGKEHRNQT